MAARFFTNKLKIKTIKWQIMSYLVKITRAKGFSVKRQKIWVRASEGNRTFENSKL